MSIECFFYLLCGACNKVMKYVSSEGGAMGLQLGVLVWQRVCWYSMCWPGRECDVIGSVLVELGVF